jgi:hypothetical protein
MMAMSGTLWQNLKTCERRPMKIGFFDDYNLGVILGERFDAPRPSPKFRALVRTIHQRPHRRL